MTTATEEVQATEDQLIDATEVARLLDVSPRTVFRMVDGGQLIPGYRVGTLRKWRRGDVVAFIRGGCKPVGKGGGK